MKSILPLCLLILSFLAKSQSIQERYDYFFQKSVAFEKEDLTVASEYADSVIMVVEQSKIEKDSLIFEAYYQKANVLNKRGSFEEALIVLSAIDTAGLSSSLCWSYLNLTSLIHEGSSRFSESLDALLRALEIAKQMDDRRNIAYSLNSMSFVYRGMNQQEKAIDVLKEMKEYCPEDDPMCTARASFNIGLMIMELNRYQEAILYFNEAVQGLEEEDNLGAYGSYYNNLASCYQKLISQDPTFYDSAIFYGEKSLSIKLLLGNLRGIANSHNQLAATYEKADDFYNSRNHALKALRIANSLDLEPLKKNALSYLITAQINLGIQDSTAHFFEQYIRVVNKLNEEANSEIVNEMAAKYESEKKDAENVILRQEGAQQRQITYLLIVIAIILVVLIVSLIYLVRLKQRTNDRLTSDKEIIQKQSEKLTQVNDLKSQFFANISHELRTPLTLIQGNADAILRINKLSLQAEEPARKIKGNVKQMTSLVNDLLDLSKIELKKNAVRLKPIYIEALVSRAVAAFSSLAESNNIQTNYLSDIPEKTVVDLDEAQFEKVLNNVIYNSFKFVGNRGKVEVLSSVKDDQVILKVIDNGPGIPAQDLPYIFDRFYQAGNYNESIKGSGLGLAISRELVEQMNGQITASNIPEGGAVIKITLPISDLVPSLKSEVNEGATEYNQESDAMPDDVLKVPSDTSVLIVEDNKLLQAYLMDILGDHFELHTADNGQEALEQLKQLKPDLILTDVMMPVMDGWTLIETIQSDMAMSKIPVIVLTAVAESSDKIKGLRLGVDDYIIKPFEVEELLIRITNVINNLRERIKWAKEFENEEPKDLLEEHQLVLDIREYVKENIADKKLNVTQLAMHLGLSERQLYRKTAESVGLSPSKLISEIRLQHARELLVSNRYDKLAQITQEIGLESTSYFSKLYQERFGKKPSDYFS